MWFSTENSFNTLVNELRTEAVLGFVKRGIKECLLRKYENTFEVWSRAFGSVTVLNSLRDILPRIWCIISVQVYELFYLGSCNKMAANSMWTIQDVHIFILKASYIIFIFSVYTFNSIQIVSVSLTSYNVNDFMIRNIRVFILVGFKIVSKHFIIWNFLELDLKRGCPLLIWIWKTLLMGEELIRGTL